MPDDVPDLRDALGRAHDALGDGYVLVAGRQVLDANAAYLRIVGRSLDELRALPSLLDLMPPDERVRAQERWIRRGLSVPVDEHYETTLARPDGTLVDVEIASVVLDAAKSVVLNVVRDVSARKRAEQALRESQERMTVLLHAAQEAIAVHDGKRVLEANPAFERMFGWRAEEARGRPLTDFVAPHDHERALARVRAREDAPYEVDGVRRDGSTFPIEVQARQMRFGGVDARVATIRDATEKRERLVAKNLVRRILSDLGGSGSVSGPARRELGRSLAAQTGARDVADALRTFGAMGLGLLAPRVREPGRLEVEGHDLLEKTPGASAPTCHIALGFLEGALAAAEGAPALGAEVACQSQGAPECRFVVRVRRT